MNKVWIGIDNGNGNFSAVWPDKPADYCQTPVRSCLNYTKTVAHITRLDRGAARKILEEWTKGYQPIVCIERPMIHPGRWKATMSGIRMTEAQEILMEDLSLAYRFLDSKEWQKVMLPAGIKGSENTKPASLEVGKRLFPHLAEKLKKDADSLLMAEYARRSNF